MPWDCSPLVGGKTYQGFVINAIEPGIHSPAESIKQTLPLKKSLALGDLSSTLGGDGETKQTPQPFLLPLFPLCKILPGPTQEADFVQESKANARNFPLEMSFPRENFHSEARENHSILGQGWLL